MTLKRKRAKPRPRGVYCTVTNRKRCPRKRYGDTDRCAVHYADKLARTFVLDRDGHRCVRCGSTGGLQWAHLRSRRYGLTRWDPDNAVTFCDRCHLWQTHNPLEGEAFFIELIGQTEWDQLRAKAMGSDKPNPVEWIEFYESEGAK